MVEQATINESAPFDRVYRWRNNTSRLPYFDKPCRILAKGTSMRSVLIEFEDGMRMVTSVRAVKKKKR